MEQARKNDFYDRAKYVLENSLLTSAVTGVVAISLRVFNFKLWRVFGGITVGMFLSRLYIESQGRHYSKTVRKIQEFGTNMREKYPYLPAVIFVSGAVFSLFNPVLGFGLGLISGSWAAIVLDPQETLKKQEENARIIKNEKISKTDWKAFNGIG
jgi:hypothetical protein